MICQPKNDMVLQTVNASVVKKLVWPARRSHKGENGRVLIFAGGKDHFGALWFAGSAAARYCDWVVVATEKTNVPIAKGMAPTFTVVDFAAGFSQIKKADSVLAGPGLADNAKTRALLKKILAHKKIPTVLDATALRVLDPRDLHANCVITPHADEFASFFGQTPQTAHLRALAKLFGGIVVLKGVIDYVASPEVVYQNRSGNAGMTKGGTGDVLSGMLAAFAAKNDLRTSALAATYLNGYAGDRLYEKQGIMFDAVDLLNEIPPAFAKLRKASARQALK